MYSQTPQYDDHTMPLAFQPQPRAGRRWAVIGAYIVGVLGLVAVAVTLAIFLSYKGSASAQLTRGDYSFIAFWISPLRNSDGRHDGKFSTIPQAKMNVS